MSPLALRELLWLSGSLLAGLVLTRIIIQRESRQRFLTGVNRGMSLPLAAAVVTVLVTGHGWGMWRSPPPRFHDEAAYLLQAEVFAGGRWAAPTPPLPEFFKQMHVLEHPVRAAKYPPGHALVLAPGVLVGAPTLMPLLLAGASAWLLILLGRRLAGGEVAFLAWLLWLSCEFGLRWRSTYFSQGTTVVCALAMWLALHRWLENGQRRWLLGIACALGWMAISRPATALALGMPVLLLVGWHCVRCRTYRDLFPAGIAGLTILTLLPLWAARTTGDWREWPLARYTADYLPWDRLGLGVDTTPPRLALPKVYEPLVEEFRSIHAEHAWERLPQIAHQRIERVTRSAWNGWRRWLAPAFLVGLLAVPHAGLFAIGSAAALIAVMLTYAHPSGWTLYYLELAPLLAFFTSAGVARLLTLGSGALGALLSAGVVRILACSLALLPLVVHTLRTDLRRTRAMRIHAVEPERALTSALSALSDARVIVFLRYPTNHHGHDALLRNPPDLGESPAWRVHDLGERNHALLQVAPERLPYVWDVGQRLLLPVDADSITPAHLQPQRTESISSGRTPGVAR